MVSEATNAFYSDWISVALNIVQWLSKVTNFNPIIIGLIIKKIRSEKL